MAESFSASEQAHLKSMKRHVSGVLRVAALLEKLSRRSPKSVQGLLEVATGPLKAFRSMHALNPLGQLGIDTTTGNRECEFDGVRVSQLIVGSGPGASIVARFGSMAGKSQLIVEKGDSRASLLPSHGVEQMVSGFEGGGLEFCISMPPIPISQGRALGGGSLINSGLYHRLPTDVKSHWCDEIDASELDFEQAEKAIEELLEVEAQTTESLGIYRNSPLIAIGKHLNWPGGVIPRWRKYGEGNSYKHVDAYSAISNRLEKTTLLTSHEVTHLKELKGGHWQVVIAGSNCSHVVEAEEVVLAGGPLSTPKLLADSRLVRLRDFGFMLHTMSRVIVEFPTKVNDLHDIDPHQFWSGDHSMKIGAAVGTPELLRATMASQSIKTEANLENVLSLYVSTASSGFSGLVRVWGEVAPFLIADKLMRARVRDSTTTLVNAAKAVGGTPLSNPKKPSLSSVHIFGTAPIGKVSFLDSEGRLTLPGGRVTTLRVRDASLIPSHPMVNPQGPLMHLVWVLENRLQRASSR